ncbi:MAG: hypothetical protein OZ921_14065, partial [Sorangiineae bacterium]|nr:hypothetical protein [Sorangiineae bacterium]
MTTLQPGNVVGGRWRIASAVPSSTGRELYLAVDATSGGEVTLELHPADALANPAAWAEYQRQAQAIAALPLEAIARLYDANVEPALARAYTVGERIGWPSLASRVASAPLPPLVAYATLEAVGHALEAANAAGFVHRELDASQVFVDPDNPARVRVTGFAAWVLHAAAPPASGWIGSPGWVAPEGVSPGAAVARTMDVYSLAALAFYALTGQLPFRALRAPSPEPGALWAELTSPFGQASQRAGELGRGLAPSLDPWFARALAPEPHARFPSVAEALTALGDAMSPGAPAQPGLKRTLLFGVDGGLAPAAPPPIAPAPAAPPPIAP